VRKVLFYTSSFWAYGSLHYGLIRRLYSRGVLANLLDWDKQYQVEEMQQICDAHDIVVTTSRHLSLVHNFGISPDKIYVVVHGEIDFNDFRPDMNYGYAKVGVVANNIKVKAVDLGIQKDVHLLRCGVDFNYYKSKPATNLKSIGFASIYRRIENGVDIKRGELVEQIAKDCNLGFNKSKHYQYLSMPSFYRSSDCIIQSSTKETIGLPMLEAACAGRLTIGSEIGYIHEFNHLRHGGIVVPTDEFGFVDKTKQVLDYYKKDSIAFHQRCKEIQEYARYNYDWEYFLDDWEAFLT
jgi:hypothetical protein